MKKILICDEDEKVRESLKLILGNHYELIATDDPQQALHVLMNAPDIGVALFDFKILELNDGELLLQLKNQHPKIRIIEVTGYQSVDPGEIKKTGISGSIGKPFKSQKILEVIKKNLK